MEDSANHKCTKCDYVSKWAANLRRHFKIAHENFREKCEICDFSATSKLTILKHKYTIHGDEEALKKITIYKCKECKFETIY